MCVCVFPTSSYGKLIFHKRERRDDEVSKLANLRFITDDSFLFIINKPKKLKNLSYNYIYSSLKTKGINNFPKLSLHANLFRNNINFKIIENPRLRKEINAVYCITRMCCFPFFLFTCVSIRRGSSITHSICICIYFF